MKTKKVKTLFWVNEKDNTKELICFFDNSVKEEEVKNFIVTFFKMIGYYSEQKKLKIKTEEELNLIVNKVISSKDGYTLDNETMFIEMNSCFY